MSALGLLAAAPPSAPLQPTANWVVNFDDAQCLAERNYGTPANPLTLVVKQPGAGSIVQLAVITKGGPNEPRQMDGSIGFDTRTPTKLSTLHYQPERSKYGVHLMNAPHDVVAGATGATVLRVRAGKIDHSFALTQFGKVLKIMDECVTDLKRVWNIASDESDRQLQGATMPNGLSGLFSSKDYPALAIDAFQSGTARLAVLVDEQGKVADCSVVETSEVAVLDAQSCVIVRKRARFKPVLGAGGKPVKSGFIQRITWRME